MTPFGKIVFLVCVIYLYGAINLVPVRVTAENVMDGEEQFERDQHPQVKRSDSGAGLTVYTRWGKKICPPVEGTTLVYAGYVAGKWYDHSGSGSNYLCLPTDPEYETPVSGLQNNRGIVYSTEYYTSDFAPIQHVNNYDVPCAVCSTTRGVMMIPAKKTCPSGWTQEYYGYLMSEGYAKKASEFVCVDRHPDTSDVSGSSGDQNGALLYAVEARCASNNGNLPCNPYTDGYELTCVVCTK